MKKILEAILKIINNVSLSLSKAVSYFGARFRQAQPDKQLFLRWLIVTGCFFIITKTFAQEQNIKVIIENVKDEQGSILIALYNSEAHYMKERFRELKLAAHKGQVSGVIENVPAGTYAISVMHDANDNLQLDTNAMGIPIEGFGFSNNAMGMFGPPAYKKVVFDFPKQKEIVIKMKY